MKYSILIVLIIIFFNDLCCMEMSDPKDAHRFVQKAQGSDLWDTKVEALFAQLELMELEECKILARLKRENQINKACDTIIRKLREKKEWGPGEIERLLGTLFVPQDPHQTSEEAIAVYFYPNCPVCNL